MTDLPLWLQYLKENCNKSRVAFTLVPEAKHVKNKLMECVWHSVAYARMQKASEVASEFLGYNSDVYDICLKYAYMHKAMLDKEDDQWVSVNRLHWSKITSERTNKNKVSNALVRSAVYSSYASESSILNLAEAMSTIAKINLDKNADNVLVSVLSFEVSNVNKYLKLYGEVNAR